MPTAMIQQFVVHLPLICCPVLDPWSSGHVLPHWMSCFSCPPHRFQTDLGSVNEWLDGANKDLKTLSDLADTSDLNQECIHSHLTKLLVMLFYLPFTVLNYRRPVVNEGLTSGKLKSQTKIVSLVNFYFLLWVFVYLIQECKHRGQEIL